MYLSTGTKVVLLSFLLLLLKQEVRGQFFNKEIKAEILVDRNSEFYTFQATAENKTPSDYNVLYEYSIFTTNDSGEVNKATREDRIYIKANEKKIITSLTVNYNLKGRTIILMIIYDLEGKPLGKDRIVLENGGKSKIEVTSLLQNARSQDQAKPQDGFILGGFVLEKTITQAGRDFYRYLYTDYYNRGIKTTNNVKVLEIPGRGRSTRIEVFVDDQLIWRFFSQPSKKFLKEQAITSMARIVLQLQRLEQQKEEFIRY